MSDLELKAANASSVIPAPELHGMVCGFAAGHPKTFSLSEFVELAGSDALSAEAAVEDFVSSTLDEMLAQDMAFNPLLPGDDANLAERIRGLAECCAGFLGGFGATVQTEPGALHTDVQEILRDFASISGLDEDVAGDEQDENSFMELFEYVRVAAILTLTLLADAAAGESSVKQ